MVSFESQGVSQLSLGPHLGLRSEGKVLSSSWRLVQGSVLEFRFEKLCFDYFTVRLGLSGDWVCVWVPLSVQCITLGPQTFYNFK